MDQEDSVPLPQDLPVSEPNISGPPVMDEIPKKSGISAPDSSEQNSFPPVSQVDPDLLKTLTSGEKNSQGQDQLAFTQPEEAMEVVEGAEAPPQSVPVTEDSTKAVETEVKEPEIDNEVKSETKMDLSDIVEKQTEAIESVEKTDVVDNPEKATENDSEKKQTENNEEEEEPKAGDTAEENSETPEDEKVLKDHEEGKKVEEKWKDEASIGEKEEVKEKEDEDEEEEAGEEDEQEREEDAAEEETDLNESKKDVKDVKKIEVAEDVKDVKEFKEEKVKVKMIDVGVGTDEYKPAQRSLGIICKVKSQAVETQTEKRPPPTILPLPTPMYMPMPMAMYQTAVPIPIPIPLPVPVPVFIPTTRNSVRGIKKQIRKIIRKIPSDLLEAKLLEMARELDPSKVGEDSDDSPYEDDDYYDDEDYDPRQEFLVQPPADLEKDIAAGRIIPKPLPLVTPDPILSPGPNDHRIHLGGQKRRYSNMGENEENQPTRPPSTRGRGRGGGGRGAKHARRDMNVSHKSQQQPVIQPPKERPDAKHHLKFTYGVNAWKHWVVQKNAELEKARAQGKYMKTFETDILKLRADELIYTLCMFVKEVRKPNGESYSPDSLFYLALGIQEYLLENGRIDNIFTDMYYEPFTNALHEVVKDFKLSVNEMGFFVTRLEEEHLWESKQLGAHSPQVLLNTLIYFNTRYFLLKTVEQHKKLSFSHIMKHWKKVASNNMPLKGSPQGQTQQKQILLRYYPPPSKGKGGKDDRRCYEQHENTDNPLRCPVKLYEFYLSKCPESTKTRNDLFYLQPERSCVPDSPVWYSTTPLNSHQLDKMLQRLLMIKEVQEHMIAEAEM